MRSGPLSDFVVTHDASVSPRNRQDVTEISDRAEPPTVCCSLRLWTSKSAADRVRTRRSAPAESGSPALTRRPSFRDTGVSAGSGAMVPTRQSRMKIDFVSWRLSRVCEEWGVSHMSTESASDESSSEPCGRRTPCLAMRTSAITAGTSASPSSSEAISRCDLQNTMWVEMRTEQPPVAKHTQW